jgi:hypothetical protein
MCRWLIAACAAVVVFACASDDARADALADARKAVEGSDYPTAKTALENAIQSGTNGPAELAEIFKLAGTVEGALGNAQQATIWFAKWLSMEAKASLPEGTSPKIKRPFDAAVKDAKKKGHVEAKAETEDNPPSVTLVISNDPQELIVGAKVYFSADKKPEEVFEAEGKERIKIELEVGKRVDLRIHGIDAYGNRVVELGSKEVPIVITSSGAPKEIVPDPKGNELGKKPQPTPSAPEEEPSWYGTWWVWGIATGVSALGTGFFAWRTRSGIQDLDTLNANSINHPWADAQEVERTTRRDLLITNIGLGVTAGLFVGTAILYLLRPDSEESSAESQPRAAVAPIPGGGALVLGGQF